jgi:hypothetical protein
MVVKQPQFTRVEEPTLLCNQVKLHAPAHLLRAERQRNIFAGTHERILNSTAADISVACAKRHPDIVDVR